MATKVHYHVSEIALSSYPSRTSTEPPANGTSVFPVIDQRIGEAQGVTEYVIKNTGASRIFLIDSPPSGANFMFIQRFPLEPGESIKFSSPATDEGDGLYVLGPEDEDELGRCSV